jgi:hypothetical protein
MNQSPKLQQRQEQLKQQINQRLDLLIGSVVRSPSMGGWCLTDKVAGKTVTRYVRKSVIADAQRMSRNCQRLWKLLRQLSRVNWQLLQEKSRQR